MNKEAIQKALEILQKRTAYYLSVNDLGRSSAYSSAVDILQYAIDNNTDCLREFDAATPELQDHTRYSDCYPGCSGEDCACCEIHADHVCEIHADYVREMSTPYEEDLYGSYDDEPPEDYFECPECCEGCRWADTCEFYEEEELIERAVVESEFMDMEDDCND